MTPTDASAKPRSMLWTCIENVLVLSLMAHPVFAVLFLLVFWFQVYALCLLLFAGTIVVVYFAVWTPVYLLIALPTAIGSAVAQRIRSTRPADSSGRS